MIFDVAGLSKEFNKRVEIYMAFVLGRITKQNPTWIDDMKKNIKEDLSEDEVEQEVNKILESPNFVKYSADFEEVKEIFLMDEKLLKQFIID